MTARFEIELNNRIERDPDKDAEGVTGVYPPTRGVALDINQQVCDIKIMIEDSELTLGAGEA